MRLLLLFIILPLVELMLLLKLAEVISGAWTFALVVLTGALGAALARRQGWGVLNRLQQELGGGQMPTTTLVDALMIFVAGALLITPGIITDVFGFSLLVPACRRVYRAVLVRWFRQNIRVQTDVRAWNPAGPNAFDRDGTDADPGDSQVIDAYVVSRKEDDEP